MSKSIIGKNLSDLSFVNQDGKSICLSDFSDNFVLLWWYPKADTPGWTIEGKGFRDRIQDFNKKGVVVFGISGDSPADNKLFQNKFSFPFEMLSDFELKESKKLGLCKEESTYATRVTLILDHKGVVTNFFDDVNPQTHALDVLRIFN